MFKLFICTLIISLLVVFIYDQIMYRLYVRSVKRGVIGQLRKYRTPHNITQFLRNIGFVWSSLTKHKEIWYGICLRFHSFRTCLFYSFLCCWSLLWFSIESNIQSHMVCSGRYYHGYPYYLQVYGQSIQIL